ncbi:mechanosensitive ion channel family protein [Magnetospira thiophila]
MNLKDLLILLNSIAVNQIAATIILLIAVFVVRIFSNRYLSHREDIEGEQRRRLLSNMRNLLVLGLIIGLVFIWAPALRTFALSLTAFAVAIIIATKELILCISGSVLKASSAAMRVGDWIEINGLRGEVVDQSLLSTTIQELGKDNAAYEFTGRTIVLPNSMFLTTPVTNERFYKRYVFHSFYLLADANADVEAIGAALVGSVETDMSGHMEVARRYMSLIEKRAGIDIRDPEPRLRLSMTNEGRVRIAVTAFLPTKEAGGIEQRALNCGLAVIRENWLDEKP